jgi:hypothetical protein
MHNAVCVEQSLSPGAQETCTALASFIDETKAIYADCTFGCTTSGQGDWGWPYLRLVPVMVRESNGDARPAVTRTERCHFELGPIALGDCPADD